MTAPKTPQMYTVVTSCNYSSLPELSSTPSISQFWKVEQVTGRSEFVSTGGLEVIITNIYFKRNYSQLAIF